MRPQKITFGDMREMGVRGVLVYCSDLCCSIQWPRAPITGIRLSDFEPRFVCTACGKRGADVRPDFHWNAQAPLSGIGYRQGYLGG